MKYILLLIVLSSCAVSKPVENEHFIYKGNEIYHSRWEDKPLTWSDIKVLGIDSLRIHYLEMNAER